MAYRKQKMREIIEHQLREIIERHNVRIHYACESGSRAWGFPSPDSDYDVRFIYTHPMEWYLSIGDRRDVIELPVDSELDVNGWELRKAFQLFRGSNPPLYEWLQSPIIYANDTRLLQPMRDLIPEYFSLRAGIHHYTSMAANALKELQEDQVKLKRCFYALRPVLAALWIVHHRECPPMEFGTLLHLVEDRPEVKQRIDELMTQKQTAEESATVPVDRVLNDYIIECMNRCEDQLKNIHSVKPDVAPLDNLFREVIGYKR